MVERILFDKILELHQIDEVLFLFKDLLNQYSVLLFQGDLGAGKTTLTKALLKQYGVFSEVSSPTFNIVNTYTCASGKKVHHFDLYRIKHIEELNEIGFWEYLDSGDLCVIEWPEMIEDYLDIDYLKLQIIHCGENQRQYLLSKLS